MATFWEIAAHSVEHMTSLYFAQGGGGTLIFYIYIGLADFFWGGQNFEIQYFLGFSEKSLFLGVVGFLWIVFWGLLINWLFFLVISNFQVFVFWGVSFLG